jgi:hypothetical protein
MASQFPIGACIGAQLLVYLAANASPAPAEADVARWMQLAESQPHALDVNVMQLAPATAV